MIGIRADKAASGEEALAIIAADPLQVFMPDIMMPGMTGLNGLKRIKAEGTAQMIS
jgi:YesN/AraC family two-component response regulator